MPTSRRQFLASSLAIAALATTTSVAAACGNKKDDTKHKEPGGSGRIAALGWGDYCTLLALGMTPVFILMPMGTDDKKDNGVGPWARDKIAGKNTTVMVATSQEMGTDILEKIAAATPSKIIAVNAGVNDADKKKLNSIAPTTVHPDKYADYQVPWQAQTQEIAKAVGQEADGNKLVDDTTAAFEEFATKHPEMTGKKAAPVIAMHGQFAVYTGKDGRGQFIEGLGFTIPENLNTGDNGQFYRYLSAENLSELDELDYLFLIDYAGSDEEAKKNPLFNNVKAVKENKMWEIPHELGTAMSYPNPLTIPWAVNQFDTVVRGDGVR